MNTREQIKRTTVVVILLALMASLIACGNAEQQMTFINMQESDKAQSKAARDEYEADSERGDTDSEEDADEEEDIDEEEDDLESEDESSDSDTQESEEAEDEYNLSIDALLKRCAQLIDALADPDAEDEQNDESEADVEDSEGKGSDGALTDEEYTELEKVHKRIQEIYAAVFNGKAYLTNKAYRERVAPYEEELDKLESRMLELAPKVGWECIIEDDDFTDERSEAGEHHWEDNSSGHDHFQDEGPERHDGRRENEDEENERWPDDAVTDGDDGFNNPDEDWECDGGDHVDNFEMDEQSDDDQENDDYGLSHPLFRIGF